MSFKDAELVKYIEVTFGRALSSFIVKTDSGRFRSWGLAGPTDNSFRWLFNRERQPIGIEGYTAEYSALNSIGIINFSQPCIEEVIGYRIVPLG